MNFNSIDELIDYLEDVQSSVLIQKESFLDESIIKEHPYGIQLDVILSYLYQIQEQQDKNKSDTIEPIAIFSTLDQAEQFRNFAFESANKSYMIVKLSKMRYEIHTRKDASLLQKYFTVL